MSFQILNLRPLGSGGNADVYLGQRSDNWEPVVVKYLREYQLSDARKAFEREVRLLCRRLRGLVPILAADLAAQRPYYVMPYLAGGSLTKHSGRLSDAQLHTIALDVALALSVLHAAFEAHGDIKPDNLLLSRDGRSQIADPLGNGGVCTMLFSQNHGGTPGYWAPEVRAGGRISRAGDVYSYGAALYHLLTGRRPQDGDLLDPSSEGCVNAPKIRQIIAACCRPYPWARPTMQEVLRVLRGEEWVNIQAGRKQRQDLFKAACVIGGLLLIGATFGQS